MVKSIGRFLKGYIMMRCIYCCQESGISLKDGLCPICKVMNVRCGLCSRLLAWYEDKGLCFVCIHLPRGRKPHRDSIKRSIKRSIYRNSKKILSRRV